jgi:hypothetical protein
LDHVASSKFSGTLGFAVHITPASSAFNSLRARELRLWASMCKHAPLNGLIDAFFCALCALCADDTAAAGDAAIRALAPGMLVSGYHVLHYRIHASTTTLYASSS